MKSIAGRKKRKLLSSTKSICECLWNPSSLLRRTTLKASLLNQCQSLNRLNLQIHPFLQSRHQLSNRKSSPRNSRRRQTGSKSCPRTLNRGKFPQRINGSHFSLLMSTWALPSPKGSLSVREILPGASQKLSARALNYQQIWSNGCKNFSSTKWTVS